MTILERGIDVSKYQSSIDWNAVKNAGYKFAFIRVGWCNYDGTITEGFDPYFERNMANAIAAGIKVGVYVYSYAKTVDAARICAQAVVNKVKKYKLEMPIAWDYEDSKLYASFGKQSNVNICKSFLDKTYELGYMPILYTYTSFANSYLDMSQLSKYEMWIADYRANCGYKGQYGIWQYSSSGSVPGINGRCDMNYAYKDYTSLIKSDGLNGYKKEENTLESLNNKLLKINMVNGRNPNQYFSTTDVGSDLGYIDVGEYKAVAKLSAMENNLWWVKFIYKDGKEYWAVYDNGSGSIADGRAVLIDGTLDTVIPTPPPVVPDVSTDITELINRLNELTKQVSDALMSKSIAEQQLAEAKIKLSEKDNIIAALNNKIDVSKKEAQEVVDALTK